MTMTSTTTAASPPLSREDASGLLGQTMGLVAVTAGVFALGAYIGRDTSGGWAILWFVAAFAVLLGMNFAAQRSEQLAIGLLFGLRGIEVDIPATRPRRSNNFNPFAKIIEYRLWQKAR